MNTHKKIIAKLTLIMVLAALAIAYVPSANVLAAGMDDQVPPTDIKIERRPLSQVWKRMQNQYERLGKRLKRTEVLTARIQERLDTAKQNGKDVSSLQAAFDIFIQAKTDALSTYPGGSAIISTHAGFDMDGKILDRTLAVKSIESLGDVVRETRDATRDPFRLLRDAIKAFREANRPTPTPTP